MELLLAIRLELQLALQRVLRLVHLLALQ